MFQWQQRAKGAPQATVPVEMFAHQYHDSATPVWLQGDHGQIYYTKILPPGEFQGTSLNAPRNPGKSGQGDRSSTRQTRENDEAGQFEQNYFQETDEPDRFYDGKSV